MDDDNSPWTSEADRLRQDIERLQLSSHSSSSKLSTSDSPPFISPTLPTTPTHLALQSDSSCSSTRKKSTNTGGKGTKRSHRDKNGDDQVKDEDLEVLADLGAGNGGTVTKVWNKKRKCVMARKVSWLDVISGLIRTPGVGIKAICYRWLGYRAQTSCFIAGGRGRRPGCADYRHSSSSSTRSLRSENRSFENFRS